MTEMAVKLITAVIGTLGITVLFGVHHKRIPFAVLGGLLSCAVYLGLQCCWDNLFACAFAAGMVAAAYSEIMARVLKTPVTIMLLPSIIPLVPGGNLYYAMSSLVFGEAYNFVDFGLKTVLIAVGIAVGILAISILAGLLVPLYRYFSFLQKEKIF